MGKTWRRSPRPAWSSSPRAPASATRRASSASGPIVSTAPTCCSTRRCGWPGRHRMEFEVQPSGPFNLASANEYFGGWFPYETGELSLAMAFPLEGWAASVLVIVREGEGGRIRGEVHGHAAESERAWRQALAALSLDVDGGGWPSVGQRDPAIGRLQERYNYLRPVLFHSPYEAAAAFIIGHRIRLG